MSRWITDDGEIERLNEFCQGKVIKEIKCDGDDMTLIFMDGSEAELSTLGGIVIEELRR